MTATLRRTFGMLRWKLAASYVLVTVLVILTIETILLLIVLPLFIRTVLPAAAASVSRTVALQLQPDFADPNRSPATLATRLALLRESSRVAIITWNVNDPRPQSTGDEHLPQDIQLALLDETGQLITATQRIVVQPGGVEAVLTSASGRTLIERALGGETANREQAVRGENGAYLAAAPVMQNQRVLGVVFVQFPLPPAAQVWSSVLAVLLTSALVVVIASGVIGLLFGLIAGRGFSRRLNRLAEASAGLAMGDLSRRVDDRSADEIGQLARQFNRMAEQLAENMRALRLLADQNAQLAERAGQLATIEERNRLARDLHDSVSQELFSLSMLAAAAKRQLAQQPAAAAVQLDDIQATAQHALQETRSLLFALRPAMLDDRGLGPALRDLVASMRERQGLAVDLAISREHRLLLEHEQALFRIVQEALANVLRHSGQRASQVMLVYDDTCTKLTIRDHGHGFDPRALRSASSIGLHSMAERAHALGGTFTLDSGLGRGTTITVTLPNVPEYVCSTLPLNFEGPTDE